MRARFRAPRVGMLPTRRLLAWTAPNRGTQTASASKAASARGTRRGRAVRRGERRIDPYPSSSRLSWLAPASASSAASDLISLRLVSRVRHRLSRPFSWSRPRCVAPLYAAVRPPKLEYQITTLPNGLRVILSEDHSTPIVHVSVWYHVGSKNERPGRTGFAHLFEHMMFKGSKNVEPESHTSIIASVGGRSNAYTTEDETVFWQTLPAQYLPLALWLEADRMATLRVDDDGVQARARGRQGRAADARREPAVRPAVGDHLRPRVHDASVQAPDDRQHGGPRGGVDRRRARVPRHLLRARERDA